MKQLIEDLISAMEYHVEQTRPVHMTTVAIQAAREALKSLPAQQEPVAIVSGYYGGQCVVLPTNPARLFNSGTAFYTAPPAAQKPWVGLTDEEVAEGLRKPFWEDAARAIEAKLKEKNT
jgi:dienelactone hydrolase